MSRKLLGALVALATLVLSSGYVQADCQPAVTQDQGCVAEFDPFGNPVDSVIFDTFQFDGIGLVGIGTNTPTGKLTIGVANEGDLALRLIVGAPPSGPNGFLDIKPSFTGPPQNRFSTVFDPVNGRDIVFVGGTLNFGIGTMLPAAKLDVVTPVVNNAGSFTKGAAFGPGTLAAVQVKNLTTLGETLWLGQDAAANPFGVLKLVLPATSTANFVTGQQPDGTQKFHITNTGTFVAGSDFAEALPARAPQESYEPGDVLVMARDGAGIESTVEGYSRRVAGVYSTRPGVLGADKNGESRVDANDVPVAIVGIVPTKVSAENGAIEVGDLLVTSSTPGHAMKGTDRARMPGAIVGKALQPLRDGTGVIRVLVTLQ